MLDCTRARLTPWTREEIHESRRSFPLVTSTVSLSLRPALLTLGMVSSGVREWVAQVAVTNLESLGKKEMKEEREGDGERRDFTEVKEKLGTGETKSIVAGLKIFRFAICF